MQCAVGSAVNDCCSQTVTAGRDTAAALPALRSRRLPADAPRFRQTLMDDAPGDSQNPVQQQVNDNDDLCNICAKEGDKAKKSRK
jgi:hypothetical protein